VRAVREPVDRDGVHDQHRCLDAERSDREGLVEGRDDEPVGASVEGRSRGEVETVPVAVRLDEDADLGAGGDGRADHPDVVRERVDVDLEPRCRRAWNVRRRRFGSCHGGILGSVRAVVPSAGSVIDGPAARPTRFRAEDERLARPMVRAPPVAALHRSAEERRDVTSAMGTVVGLPPGARSSIIDYPTPAERDHRCRAIHSIRRPPRRR
jgi:hypothetical protein